MEFSAKQIAQMLQGTVVGDAQRQHLGGEITGPLIRRTFPE